jgi:glycosyltransferase involved in cell wall biosynthesis
VKSLDEKFLAPITSKYLLVVNIPLYRDASDIVAGLLWFKDLLGHLDYLENFAIACPVLDGRPPEETVSLSADRRFASVDIIELPAATSVLHALFALPRTVRRLWKAIQNADIIHTVVAGWPIPYGWIVTPIAKLFGKKVVIIVESAPWRLNPGRLVTFKLRLAALVYETLAHWCVSRSNLAIFTQEDYRRSLLRRNGAKGHIIHASWIDEDVIISDEEARNIWQRKLNRPSRELAILFAGRLDRQKGLGVLLDAMRLVAQRNLRIKLDILGSGELAQTCREVGDELKGLTRVAVLGTVAYGAPLFQLLQQYHAVILPSVSDEQPRIVYDAYSQGVPVIATRTTGLQACVVDGRTGWFVEPNSAHELSRIIEIAASNIDELRTMGMKALDAARSMTHQRMHRERHRLLLDLIHSTRV